MTLGFGKSIVRPLVVGITTLMVLTACQTSPTGRSQLVMFSPAEMDQMGAQSYAQLKQEEPLNNDPQVNAYVQCVTDALIAELPQEWRTKQWEINVFANEAVNAFALPGEKIGVYDGLLKVAETPDQLAAVIGHEIGHVIAAHGNERMSNQMAAGLGLQLGGVLAAEVVDQENLGLVMGVLGLGVQLGYILPYSRTHESEADQLGMDYMADAGFNPAAAAELWRNMARATGGNPPEFLSTHPSPQSRIDALEAYRSQVEDDYQQALATQGAPNCRRPNLD